MVAKRLVALVVAVVLVVGAVVVRDRLDARGSAATTADATPRPDAAGAAVQVVCLEELEEVCAALGDTDTVVTTQSLGQTLTALADGSAAADAWVTLTPLPELAAVATGDGGAGVNSTVVPVDGATGVVAVAREDRAAVLDEACEGGFDWRCLGDAAPQTWEELGAAGTPGEVRIGFADPDASAEGLLALAQASAGWFGDVDFSRNDLDDPAFFAWFAGLADARPNALGPDPLQQLITQRASLDVVITFGVPARRALEQPGADGLVVRDAGPQIRSRVVVTGLGDDGSDAAARVAGQLPAALTDAGWSVADDGAVGSADDAAADTGSQAGDNGAGDAAVPSGGALQALRELWGEVGR